MEWINIKDSMPDENKNVLCFLPSDGEFDDSIMICYYYRFNEKNIWWCACRQDVGPVEPSHWMFLPEKPNKE
jgi:hypothetical protein